MGENSNICYCRTCGKKLVSVLSNTFDPVCGTKESIRKCPTGVCGHTNIEHDFQVTVDFILFQRKKCVHCGERPFEY